MGQAGAGSKSEGGGPCPAVKRALRRTAAELDIKTHDLVLEGIDLVLKKHGKTTIKLDGTL